MFKTKLTEAQLRDLECFIAEVEGPLVCEEMAVEDSSFDAMVCGSVPATLSAPPCFSTPAEEPVAKAMSAPEPARAAMAFPGLDEELAHLDAGFGETLLRLIDDAGITDAEAYRRANVSRQLFAKIRRDPHYQPTKATACAFVIALGLSEGQAEELLGRAGYTLSGSRLFDVICRWAIQNGIADVSQVNYALYIHDQPLLGSQPR